LNIQSGPSGDSYRTGPGTSPARRTSRWLQSLTTMNAPAHWPK